MGALASTVKTTKHTLIQGDSRRIPYLEDESVHLIVTSPPYWTLKRYNEGKSQLGHIDDYELFLSQIGKV
jgi:DNA modification methylase